ncbi:MAG: FKBP-type peptidyl-prolyl cis-trans isomerase [Steroidobacteraceae bacterium]
MRVRANLLCLMLASGLLAACHRAPAPTAPVAGAASLIVKDLKAGTGPAITAGQTAEVHYTGWLYEASAPDNKGRQFDSSRDSGRPFSFVIGAGQVIDGWDKGVAGMQAGGQRRLVVPADLAYGSAGAGSDIPPGATLVFDVELLSIH